MDEINQKNCILPNKITALEVFLIEEVKTAYRPCLNGIAVLDKNGCTDPFETPNLAIIEGLRIRKLILQYLIDNPDKLM